MMQIFPVFIPFLLFGKCLCSNEPSDPATVQANASTTNGTVPSFVVPAKQESPIKSSFKENDDFFVALVLEPKQENSTYTAEDVLAVLDNKTLTEKITSVLDNETLSDKSISQITFRNMNLGEFTGTVLNGVIEKLRNLELISPKNDLNSLNSFKDALMNEFRKVCDKEMKDKTIMDKIEKSDNNKKSYFEYFKNFIILYTDDIFIAKSKEWNVFLENWEYCINFCEVTLKNYSMIIKEVINEYNSNTTLSKDLESLTKYFECNLDKIFEKIIKMYVRPKDPTKADIEKIKFALFKKCIVPFAEDILKLKLDAVFKFCENKWFFFSLEWNNCTKVPLEDVQKYRSLVQNIIDNHEDNGTSSTFNSLTEYFKSKLDEEFKKNIIEFQKFPDLDVLNSYFYAVSCISSFENIPHYKISAADSHKPVKDLIAYLKTRNNGFIQETFNYVDSMLSKYFEDIYNVKDHGGIKDDRKCYDYKEKYEDACIDMFRKLFLKKKRLTFVFEKSSYDENFSSEKLNVASFNLKSSDRKSSADTITVEYYLWPTSI